MGKNSFKFKRGGRGGRAGRGGQNHRRGKGFPRQQNFNNDWNKNRNTSNREGSNTNGSDQTQRVSLKEDQVGITEFVCPCKGFTGVVKARFSDFHVNEIDPDGNVLSLTDFTIPRQVDPDVFESSEDLEAAKKEIAGIVNDELWGKMDKIAKRDTSEPFEFDVSNLDKEQRGAVHKVIKNIYKEKIKSITISKEDDKKSIQIVAGTTKLCRRNKWAHPGEYVHFLMYKENMDTSEAAGILSSGLGLKPSLVNFCGTKDKRAKTTQKLCIKHRHPHQIANAVGRVSKRVKIGNFTFHEKVLKLGDLKGNRFRIALRHVAGDREDIEKSLQSVKEFGFINYYGLQRFGNNACVPTYEVGKALLRSDYKKACELILKPRENDLPFLNEIREKWWKDRDSAAAAEMFRSGNRSIEKSLLEGLVEYGENDYANALRKIPRNTLLLYTHAYQSLVFNRMASKRIKEHGLKLIVGDLVYRNREELDDLTADTDVEALENEEAAIEEDAKEPSTGFKEKVKPLTEEEISSGKYTIFDIVQPLPGHDITYPANEVGKWYEETLAEDGLTSEKLKHNVKTYSLAGAYRKVLIQPQNMSWYFKKYNTPEEDLIPSHFEDQSPVDKSEGEGNFTALVLDFCLPASVYATMFLREVLKSDTSASNQAKIGRDEMEKYEALRSVEKKDEATSEQKRGRTPTEDEEPDVKKSKEDDE